MNMDLVRPCANCPFRADRPFPLRRQRARELADGLLGGGDHFPCHKTLRRPVPEQQQCAGALIMLEKAKKRSQLMRTFGRLGFYAPERLDMDAPVYPDFDAFVEGVGSFDEATSPPPFTESTGEHLSAPSGRSMQEARGERE